jgi:transposase
MGDTKTAQGIARWAEKKTKPAESPSYTRLTDSERIAILVAHDKGETQTAIAQRLGRSVSTINDIIQAYAPTDLLAKRKLRASALRMAENIVDNGLPRDHVAALKGINVLEESDSSVPRVVVQIGVSGGDVQVQVGETPQPQLDAPTLSPPLTGDLHSLSADNT